MIDWDRVAELRDEIGAEDFAEVVDLFLTEVEAAIVQLFGPDGEAVGTEEQMHFLKGAALNLGFRALAEICRKGEQAAATGQADRVSPTEVKLIYDSSKIEFQRDFEKRFAA